MTATHTSPDKTTLTFVDPPEPEGAIPPKLGAVDHHVNMVTNNDPFFFAEAKGDVQVSIDDELALEFSDHRPGQLGSLLASTPMDGLTTVYVNEGVMDTSDFEALHEARISTLRLGVNQTSRRTTEGTLELPRASDLSKMPWLYNLEVRGVDFTGDHLRNLGSGWNLRSLSLDGVTATPAALNLFGYLEELHVNGDETFGHDFVFLDCLTRLDALGIRFSGLTQAGLPEIIRRVHLSMVDIAYNNGIGPDLSALGDNEPMRYLDVSGTGADETTIATLTGNKELSILLMQRTDVNDRGLEALRDLPQITHLNLAGTKITDVGLRTIVEALPELRTLDIRATDVTVEGAKVLSNLEHMWRLGLSDPLLTVDFTKHMRDEGSVTELIVGVGLFEMTDEQTEAFCEIECGYFPGRPG